MKKKILSLILIVFMVLANLIPIFSYANKNIINGEQQNYSEGDIDNSEGSIEESNVDNIDENEENYTEEYKEYLKLSDEEKSKINVIPRKYNVSFESLYENMSRESETSALYGLARESNIVSDSITLPAKYNLRDYINIPPKDQGSEGLCWAFASIRCLETNLALQKNIKRDFSERHLDYLTTQDFGKKAKIMGINLSAATREEYGSGGNFGYFTAYAKDGYGPVVEEKCKYNEIINLNDNKNDDEEVDNLLNLGKNAWFSVFEFPNISAINMKEGTYNTNDLENLKTSIKTHIQRNGSIYVSINSTGIKKFEDKTYSTLYNNSQTTTGHAVSIIGWDDTFSRYNFTSEEGTTPNKNGAWIALNSWGGDYNTAYDGTDVLYISYEDITAYTNMNGVISADVKKLEKIEITEAPTKTSYVEGQRFEKSGMCLYATYSNGEGAVIFDDNDGLKVEGGENLKNGQGYVTITYTEHGETKKTTQAITVEKKQLNSIKIRTEPTKTTYIEGENFDKTGMVVTAIYNDDTKSSIVSSNDNLKVENGENLTIGQASVTISYTYNGVTKTTSQGITVTAKTLTGIAITKAPTNTNYIAGQNFDKTGMVVTATYNNGITETITGYKVLERK